MNFTFTNLVLYFTIYSVIGWICESTYCAIIEKKFTNRGFLYGPYLPIYGFGAVLIVWATAPVQQQPWLVFLIALALTTSLEYFTSWLLEALFQLRWWDYSDKKFNIRGRVCLQNSLIFGVLGLVVVYLLQPLIDRFLLHFDPEQARVVAALIIVVFVLDLTKTLDSLTKLNDKLKSLHALFKELGDYNEQYHWLNLNDLNGSVLRLREICENNREDARAAQILLRLDKIMDRKDASLRLLAAFPNLASTKLDVEIMGLRIYWTNYGRKWTRIFKRYFRKIRVKTVRLARDLNPFAEGVNFYKMVWVFLIASVLGFFIETIFCWVRNGYIESRQGMIYGPFSQVYGFGAVLMAMLLNPLVKKPVPVMFIAGALLGGGYEIICSMIQEFTVGTVSWSYSEASGGFAGGRTSLAYMFFWGVLAVVYMYLIYPRISDMIERIPHRQGVFFTWTIFILLCMDLALSGIAVNRWNDRLDGVPPGNAFNEFLDQHYNNEMMQEIYPNMQHRNLHVDEPLNLQIESPKSQEHDSQTGDSAQEGSPAAAG